MRRRRQIKNYFIIPETELFGAIKEVVSGGGAGLEELKFKMCGSLLLHSFKLQLFFKYRHALCYFEWHSYY